MNLLNNIIQNFLYLKHDFIGIHFYQAGFLDFCLTFLSCIVLFISWILIGENIFKLIFKKTHNNIFFNLVIGYIVFGTGIAVLGVFSILYRNILIGYIFLFTIFSFFPIYNLKDRL